MDNNSLENRVVIAPSLKQELVQSARDYPSTWKSYAKQLAPAIVVSSAGAAFGQWVATKLGYDGKAAVTGASYLCGYVPGYLTFFGLEYWKNRQTYQSVFSKKFGEFVSTFLAADYIADITTFTPTFIASNIWLMENSSLNPVTRGITAWNIASILYISSISALHPLTRRVTTSINKKVKSLCARRKAAEKEKA